MSILPTSFSALDSFETCPLKHYLTRIEKSVKEPPSEAMMWGNSVHKALEKYLKDGTPLKPRMKMYQPYADKLKTKYDDADLLVENQLSVTENFQPTGWWDKNGWFRGIIDVAVIRGNKAYVFDWKTGKQKDNFDQLMMFAALITSHYPDVEQIHSSFIWLQPKQLTTETYSQEAARKFWANITPRIDKLEKAALHNKWPARPSGLCRKWCPVGRANCEHCGA